MTAINTQTCPKKFFRRGVEQARDRLSVYQKADPETGEANPHYLARLAEVEAMEVGLAQWEAFAEWVETHLEARENSYDLKKGYTVVIAAGKGFYRPVTTETQVKVQGTVCGKWFAITREQAWEAYQASTNS